MANLFGAPPEVAAEQQADQPQQDEPEQASTTEEQAEPASEAFEVDGVEYQLPKELKAKVAEWKDGYVRREDYTRKTQDAAELHRQAAVMHETFQRAQAFEQGITAERGELKSIEHQLGQFKGLDWTALDTDQIVRLRGQMDNLRDRAQEIKGSIDTKQGEFSQWADGKKREVLQSGQKYLQQTIPGWGEAATKEVISSAKEVGYSEKELESVSDARFVRLAWKAAQFDKLQAGKSAAVATAQKAPPVVKPGASKGPGVASEQKYRDARTALKKSGDHKDAARALLARGF